MWFPILLLSTTIWLFYKYYISIFNHWKKRGVPQVAGKFPFGSSANLSLMKEYVGYTHQEMYKKFSSEPFFGLYMMRTPFLVVRSPEIISMILIREFSHFRDRQYVKLHEKDFLSQHLFNASGDHWKTLRVKLSPTFTSGKLKAMLPLFIKSAENLDSHLLKNTEPTIEAKELVARFTTDIICNCAFGVEANSIEDPDNEVRKIGIKAMKVNLKVVLKLIVKSVFPELGHIIPISFFEEDVSNFITNLINDSVKYRAKNNVKRNDFLDLLIQLKNKGTVDDLKDDSVEPLEMTTEIMAANCLLFFVAGFETSSSVQSFCLYEMAVNPHIQERVQKDIDEMIKKHGGLTYEAIRDMSYLDLVVKETMRKYPTLPYLTRICTKSLKLPNDFVIEKGDSILIPLWSLHHDPQYFPNPEKFDPERFSDENKDLIKPCTYLAFGDGPRFCIGKRFGLLQTKMGLITILKRYTVEPTKDTVIPLTIKGPSFTTMPNDPINLKCIPRQKL